MNSASKSKICSLPSHVSLGNYSSSNILTLNPLQLTDVTTNTDYIGQKDHPIKLKNVNFYNKFLVRRKGSECLNTRYNYNFNVTEVTKNNLENQSQDFGDSFRKCKQCECLLELSRTYSETPKTASNLKHRRNYSLFPAFKHSDANSQNIIEQPDPSENFLDSPLGHPLNGFKSQIQEQISTQTNIKDHQFTDIFDNHNLAKTEEQALLPSIDSGVSSLKSTSQTSFSSMMMVDESPTTCSNNSIDGKNDLQNFIATTTNSYCLEHQNVQQTGKNYPLFNNVLTLNQAEMFKTMDITGGGQDCPCLCHELLRFGLLTASQFPQYLDTPTVATAEIIDTSSETSINEIKDTNILLVKQTTSTFDINPNNDVDDLNLDTEFKNSLIGNYKTKENINLSAKNNGGSSKTNFLGLFISRYLGPSIPTPEDKNNKNNGLISNNTNTKKKILQDLFSFGSSHLTNQHNSLASHYHKSSSPVRIGSSLKPHLILEQRPENLPPKNPEEAEQHTDLYNQLIEASKKREAKEIKKERKLATQRLKQEEKLDHCVRIWLNEIIPNWDTSKNLRKTYNLWSLGLPPCVRGRVWYLALIENVDLEKKLDSEVIDTLFACCDDLLLETEQDHQTAQNINANISKNYSIKPQNNINNDEILTHLCLESKTSTNDPNNKKLENDNITTRNNMLSNDCLNQTKKDIIPCTFSPDIASTQDTNSTKNALANINLDVSRTFPHLAIFQDGGPYHNTLNRLLISYTLYNPEMAYAYVITAVNKIYASNYCSFFFNTISICLTIFKVQGMSFIAAILLLNMDLKPAFISFCCLMELPCFQTFYGLDQENMARYFELYSEFLDSNCPSLYEHFQNLNFTPDLYLTDWIFTIYSKSVHLDITCRIWDIFLRDGETFLFKTALGILKLYEDILLNMDFIQSAQFLTKLPETLTCHELFKAIDKIAI